MKTATAPNYSLESTTWNRDDVRILMGFRCAACIVMGIAIVAAFTGMNRAPLESHEAYVVQSAREMHERGDWVVPYFHQEPRLNKPPLNYWLTAVAARFSNYEFAPWQGRLVSAVSCVLVVGLTMWIARMLFTRSVSLLAGTFAATSTGMADFSHNARPDMLYTLWCTLVLALFVFSWRRRGHGWTCILASYGMWAAVGMAVLTKGPHQPLIFIVGFVVLLITHRPSRPHFWRILRPVTGILLPIAIAAPWWLMLNARVGSEALGNSQLSGARYGIRISNVLEPLYFWQGWKLLLPWVIAWPAFLMALAGRAGGGGRARFLALLIALTFVVLAFGGGKRWHYVLPLAAPAFILMAIGTRKVLTAWSVMDARWQRWPLLIQSASCVVILVLAALLPNRPALNGAATACLLIGLVLMSLAVGTAAARTADGDRWTASDWWRSLGCTAAVIALFVVVVQMTGILESDRNWNRARFWQTVGQHIRKEEPLFAVKVNTSLSGFYGDRFARSVESIDELIDQGEGRLGSGAAVVIERTGLDALAARLRIATVVSVPDCEDNGDSWVLATIQ